MADKNKQRIIILGGNSSKNLPWSTELREELSKQTNPYLHIYEHWGSNNDIDLSLELKRLVSYVHTQQEKYFIVSKSAGSVLALQGIAQGMLKPASLICIGLPISFARYKAIPLEQLVVANSQPTLYIQAENDPIGNAHEVTSLINNHGKLIITPGDSHDYPDIAGICRHITEFIH